MPRQSAGTRINIRPEVSILSVLRHLNYKPWFALAEFVDNSIQSFRANRQALQAIHGDDAQLSVDIILESDPPGRIIVRDNAAGISNADYARAFKPPEVSSVHFRVDLTQHPMPHPNTLIQASRLFRVAVPRREP